MEPDKLSLLNVRLDNVTKASLLENLQNGLVVTPNIDHMVKLQKDRDFYKVYEDAEFTVLDSRVIKMVMRMTGKRVREVIPGSELFPSFYEYHRENPEIRIFLLGAAPGVATKAMENINNKVGRQMVVGAHSPSFGFEKDPAENREIIEIINASGANVLAVGVGAPKQEKWASKYRDQMPGVRILLCIGATIDFEAGNLKRAPKIFRILAMEWFYRLLMEPRRLFKRYIVDLIFFRDYFKQLIGTYRDPFAEKYPNNA